MIKRRTALGLMGATAALAAASGTAQARRRAVQPPDLGDPRQLALAFRKLAYSLDDSVTYWWMRGTRYGVVDSVATPFWDMYVGAWFRTRTIDADSYEVTMVSANFYTPPNSSELLETFLNPYTKATVPVKYATPRPFRTVMGIAGGSAFGGDIPGMKSTRSDSIGPGWIEGDDVVIRGDMSINAVPLDAASGAKALTVNDWSSYIGTVADVVDPKVKNPPCTQLFNDVLTWPKWLQMGDQPGSFVSRCFGRKAYAYEQMPATWRQLCQKALPDVAKDPVGFLKAK